MFAISRSAFFAVLVGLGTGSTGCEPNLPPDTSPVTETRPKIRVPKPVESAGENQSRTLLQEYVGRERIEPEEPPTWDLPTKSKRIVAALLITAAHDRLEDLPLIVTPDARWGLPETRMFNSRPIFDGDDGERFFQAFRTAASRFPHDTQWRTQPLLPGMSEAVRSGAEPMWSFYAGANERIYIRLVYRQGRAWIDYVGLFEEPPTAPIRLVNQGFPPPLAPPARDPESGRIHVPDGGPMPIPRPRRPESPPEGATENAGEGDGGGSRSPPPAEDAPAKPPRPTPTPAPSGARSAPQPPSDDEPG